MIFCIILRFELACRAAATHDGQRPEQFRRRAPQTTCIAACESNAWMRFIMMNGALNIWSLDPKPLDHKVSKTNLLL